MSGTTTFPGAIDTGIEVLPTTQENESGKEHDVNHNNKWAAIIATQTELRAAIARTTAAITGSTTRTVPITAGALAIVNGVWILTTDGTNSLYGQVSSGGGTSSIVIASTGMLIAGTANSIAVGSPVVLAGAP